MSAQTWNNRFWHFGVETRVVVSVRVNHAKKARAEEPRAAARMAVIAMLVNAGVFCRLFEGDGPDKETTFASDGTLHTITHHHEAIDNQRPGNHEVKCIRRNCIIRRIFRDTASQVTRWVSAQKRGESQAGCEGQSALRLNQHHFPHKFESDVCVLCVVRHNMASVGQCSRARYCAR